MEPVEGEELLRRVRRGKVTVLDVRPVKARLREVPKDREVVAYCRGPYCVMAIDAVELLRKKGFTAHRMEQGVVDWRARGWRVVAKSVPRAKTPRRADAPPTSAASREVLS